MAAAAIVYAAMADRGVGAFDELDRLLAAEFEPSVFCEKEELWNEVARLMKLQVKTSADAPDWVALRMEFEPYRQNVTRLAAAMRLNETELKRTFEFVAAAASVFAFWHH